MDFVQQALIHQEMKQAAQPGQSRGTESALMGSKPREPPKCYKCGVVGHIRRNCPTTKRKSKGRSKSSYKPTHKAKAAEGKHRQQDSESESDDSFAVHLLRLSEV